tara:strand:+ start:8378 stop:9490 length:1113 start_codon:yes stop_codon:yes gene_type:complete
MSPKVAKKFICEQCDYRCCKKSDMDKHKLTAKHKNRTNPNNNLENRTENSPKVAELFECKCGKVYKARNSLWYHKKKCNGQQTPSLENTIVEVEDKRDKRIEEIMKDSLEMNNLFMKDSQEMKNLLLMFVKNQQDVAQKQQENTVEIITGVIKSLPPMGNTTNTNTNSHNNTLNFYLTNTCKDAESIHDFTERFVARSIEFFKDNFRQVASNQVDLASSVYEIMNNCMNEKPQNEKFIQTTDVKNGILYVKEKKKNEQRQLYGEAEFVKHIDGFEKAGINLEHAINKVFLPMKEEFTELLKLEFGNAPDEDNFEDEEEFEEELYKYNSRVMELKRNMCLQTYNTSTVFDKKHIRDEILARTKRIKEQAMV